MRAFALEPQASVTMRFFPSVSGLPLQPRWDYDETATIAYNLCVQVGMLSRGIRGGDLTPRGANALDHRIVCPGVLGWSQNSAFAVNRTEEMLAAASDGQLMERIADWVTAPGWYSAAPEGAEGRVPNRSPATRSCSASAPVSGFYEAQVSSSAGGNP